jgi:hypothetical protein
VNRSDERAAIEQLAQLLDGELTAEEANAPVRALAALATDVRESETVPAPTPAFRAALRNRLVADIEHHEVGAVQRLRDAAWQRTARWRHSAKVGVATAVAGSLLGGAGIAAAAQQALPGDALYGIKRATESFRLALAGSLEEQGRVHLGRAVERLEELRDGVGRLSGDQVVDTLEAMDEASATGADALIDAAGRGGDAALLDELRAFTSRQRTGLVSIYSDLPIQTRPFADTSLELLRRIDVRVVEALAACDCAAAAGGGDVAAVAPPAGAGTHTGADCDCVATPAPPPARDPGVVVPEDPVTDGAGDDDDGSEPGVSGTTDDGLGISTDGLELDEPFDDADDVDDAVQDAVEDVGDVAEDLADAVTSPSPSDASLPTVDELLDPVTEPLPAPSGDGLLDSPLD